MTISNIKDLKAVIQLCRKSGVHNITIDNITMTITPTIKKSKAIDFSNDFPEANISVPMSNILVQAIADKIATDELTDEQLLFYSSGGAEQ